MSISTLCKRCREPIIAQDEDGLVAQVQAHAHDDGGARGAHIPTREHILRHLRPPESAENDPQSTTWMTFFLECVEHQARDTIARAGALNDLRDDYRRRTAGARSAGTLGLLIDELFHVPALTNNKAIEVLGVTHRAAAQNIDKLVVAGIVVETRSRGRTRQFVAHDIMNVVEGQPLRHPAGS